MDGFIGPILSALEKSWKFGVVLIGFAALTFAACYLFPDFTNPLQPHLVYVMLVGFAGFAILLGGISGFISNIVSASFARSKMNKDENDEFLKIGKIAIEFAKNLNVTDSSGLYYILTHFQDQTFTIARNSDATNLIGKKIIFAISYTPNDILCVINSHVFSNRDSIIKSIIARNPNSYNRVSETYFLGFRI